ncbi:hypothetical protein JTE90_026261 [Oedothorax gibbosus]|uniref:Uncharacterized protein n=1 Tax=Oedothorax gibbosus TaxID=931172 RepID=A0AAV6TTZ1_9ARAC|nr:hypothetical protein JTE90_026261 [Oedothorax gibbosus]
MSAGSVCWFAGDEHCVLVCTFARAIFLLTQRTSIPPRPPPLPHPAAWTRHQYLQMQHPAWPPLTPFFLNSQQLEVIPDHVPSSFLDTPIGFQLFQNTEEIEKILDLGKKIGESCLAHWQRLDAFKSFFFLALNFPMRTGQFSKDQLRQVDNEVRKFLKVTLNLVGPAVGGLQPLHLRSI